MRALWTIGLLQQDRWYARRGGAPIVVDGHVVGAAAGHVSGRLERFDRSDRSVIER
jgi:hypothetical protein